MCIVFIYIYMIPLYLYITHECIESVEYLYVIIEINTFGEGEEELTTEKSYLNPYNI